MFCIQFDGTTYSIEGTITEHRHEYRDQSEPLSSCMVELQVHVHASIYSVHVHAYIQYHISYNL